MAPDEANPGKKEAEELIIDVLFRQLAGGGYTISVLQAGQGAITPSRTYGDYLWSSPQGPQTFTATPEPGYMLAALFVDGMNMGRVNSYTFTDVQENHTIRALFEEANWPYCFLHENQSVWAVTTTPPPRSRASTGRS